MIFVNCTPHALTIEGVGTLPASGIVPRCATVRAQCPDVGGVRVIAQQRGGVTGLPAPVAGTAYIVSGMVLDALWEEGTDRAGIDVFAPDTGADAVRENGQIVAVRGLVC